MYLIVGLGNPSGKYEHTRHNAGFDCIDILAEKLSVKIRRSMHQAHFGKCKLGDKKLILAKPQTYMNLSGHAVQNIMHFYKIEPSNLIVIYDDTDLEPGRIRIRKKGSAGGHNGMKDIIRMIGTQDFVRIRIGVGGRPEDEEMVDYVLGRAQGKERELTEEAMEKAADAVLDIVEHDADHAMNLYNA